MKLISVLKLLFIGLWLGSAVFFVGVAQSAFSILPTRESAGLLVSTVLAMVNIGGVIIGAIVLVLSFFTLGDKEKVQLLAERILILGLIVSCSIGHFAIAASMASLRTLMGRPVDEVSKQDPLKIQFDDLHQYSVWVLMAGMIIATLLFFVSSGVVRKSDR